ncbi:MAG TPA: phytoene/squalene synthase family protein [Phnomibacter sp.]|nr:phytoene/squalene synthase family protein [Phnomibacter sp.]
MMKIFDRVSEWCSRNTTEQYSTSFSSAIRMLHSDLRQPIHNIYGFVRFADEIVDTFHDFDKETLLAEFKQQTYLAIDRGISLNPILNSFQRTVNEYGIDLRLVEAFFRSMELDLDRKQYDQEGYEEYIYGSAEVVGLMCLYVFCAGDKKLYEHLKAPARSLGAAFQKVNFLRDLKADHEGMDRTYFPECDFNNFSGEQKACIEADIQKDFDDAYQGIIRLPLKARFGVYVAYKYYLSLFKKIKRVHPQRIMEERIRIPNYGKVVIVAKAGLRSQLNIL